MKLVQYLRERRNLARYLGDAAERVHFADVNMVAWEKTPAHLWELMLRALLNATRGVVEPAESATVIQIAREQRTLDRRSQSC